MKKETEKLWQDYEKEPEEETWSSKRRDEVTDAPREGVEVKKERGKSVGWSERKNRV